MRINKVGINKLVGHAGGPRRRYWQPATGSAGRSLLADLDASQAIQPVHRNEAIDYWIPDRDSRT